MSGKHQEGESFVPTSNTLVALMAIPAKKTLTVKWRSRSRKRGYTIRKGYSIFSLWTFYVFSLSKVDQH